MTAPQYAYSQRKKTGQETFWLQQTQQVPSLRWQAARSACSWYATLCKTMSLLRDRPCLTRLGLTFPHTLGMGQQTDDVAPPWLVEECGLVDKLFRFITNLCSFRAWSQVSFCMLLPQAFAVVHHENVEARQGLLQRVRNITEAVLRAEGVVFKMEGAAAVDELVRADLEKVLHDVGFHALQMAREGMGVASEAGWRADDAELRLWSFLVFARPCSTKFMLEDVFNHVSDVARRQSKNHTLQRRRI